MSNNDKNGDVCPGACQNEIANGRACASGECVRATYETMRKFSRELAFKVMSPRSIHANVPYPMLSPSFVTSLDVRRPNHRLDKLLSEPGPEGKPPFDSLPVGKPNRLLTQEELEELWSGLNDTTTNIDGAEYLAIHHGKHRSNRVGGPYSVFWPAGLDDKILNTTIVKPVEDEK